MPCEDKNSTASFQSAQPPRQNTPASRSKWLCLKIDSILSARKPPITSHDCYALAAFGVQLKLFANDRLNKNITSSWLKSRCFLIRPVKASDSIITRLRLNHNAIIVASMHYQRKRKVLDCKAVLVIFNSCNFPWGCYERTNKIEILW